MAGRLMHTGLFFSVQTPLDEVEATLSAFWRRLGYQVKRVEIPAPLPGHTEIDRAGFGVRFWIYSGQDLVLSYSPNCHGQELIGKLYGRHARGLHVSLLAVPHEYRQLRDHPNFERETDSWDHGAHSVFLKGPWGLEVEFEIHGLIPADDTHG